MTLDEQVRAAHACNDGAALAKLYAQAADEAGNVDAECFLLTHAFVFALEAGLPEAAMLNARLVAHNRAHPIDLHKEAPHA